MPPQARRRSRREIEEEDDEDTTRYRSDSATDNDGPKRQRRQAAEEDDEDEDEDEEEEEVAGVSGTMPRSNGLNGVVDKDGFHPGTIRRVKLQNFVTYTDAEFFPGPSLNMVLGPNGTGKSSLVCAICIGLGYSPKLMGRASSAKDFIKNGTSVAIIEIELQRRRQDQANPVVRVQIDRERSALKWWLNGKEATHKAVQKTIRELNIQIDNLCQFLPQDRVVEFAGLSPVELLHETLRAAAPQEMLSWQEQLQDLHKDHKDLQARSTSLTETLGNYENRQQAVQADVDRLREREAAQERVQDLKLARTIVVYQEARTQHRETLRLVKEAQRRAQQLQEESGPSLVLVSQKQAYQEAVARVFAARKEAVRSAEGAADALLNSIDNINDEVTSSSAKIEAEQQAFTAKRQEIAKANKKIGELENKLKNKPADFDPAEYNQRIRAQEHELRELEAVGREARLKVQNIKMQGHHVVQEKNRLEEETRQLDTREGQQLKLIEKQFPDVVKGWKWLQENPDKFDQEVFAPPAISCAVKDKRYADNVQSLLNADDFMCFITQSKEDHKKLSGYFYKELGLSVSIRTCFTSLLSFPKLPREEAASLGFDSTAIDCLSGPEPVLAMLCNEKRLHIAGVALKDIDEHQYSQLMQHDKVTSWATGQQSYRVVRRRELDPGAVSTTTREIQPGRWWKDEADSSGKEELQRRLDEIQTKFADMKQESNEAKSQMTENDTQQNAKRDLIKDLKDQKGVLQKEHTEYKALPNKLEHERSSRDGKREELESIRVAVAELQIAFDKLLVRKARAVLKHHASIASMRQAQERLVEAHIREIEATSDLSGLKDRNLSITQKIDEQRKVIEQLNREKQQQRQQAELAQQGVIEACEAHPNGREHLEEVAGQKTVGEIDLEIQAEEAKLELIHAANPNVIRDFEKRAREIERLREKMEAAQSKSEDLARQIQRIRNNWEPRLDELVSKINDAFAHNFEQISCAGEVRVHKDEDFDQWALDIRVKFRENETLQQLDQQRQSGGERAVSTVFFLMALQAMAQAPFRVVDEINQGMDPRNERMVHSRMVEIACDEHTSQYFLITPKLLPGLDYHERMRTLIIASGEHMPTDGGKLDFKRCLALHKRSVKAAA